jgi:hypothetical protein
MMTGAVEVVHVEDIEDEVYQWMDDIEILWRTKVPRKGVTRMIVSRALLYLIEDGSWDMNR